MCCTNWYKNAGCKFLVTKKRDNSYNIMLGITATLVGSFIKVFQKPIREWERRTNVVVVIVFLFSSHIILLNEIYLQGLTLTKKVAVLQIHSSYELPLESVGRNDELTFVFLDVCASILVYLKCTIGLYR